MGMRAAAIVCPGPSLDVKDIPRLHEQCDMVVAVNRAYKAWDDYPHLQPDLIYAADGPHRFKLDERAEIEATGAILVTRNDPPVPAKWKEMLGKKRVRTVQVERESGVNKDPISTGKVWRPMMTALFAWQDLALLGFDALCFYGCDCHCFNRQQYWYDDPTDQSEWPKRYRSNANAQYETVKDTLAKWIPLAGEHGVLTFNLSEQSLLSDIMPTIRIGEIAKWIYETS